MKNLTTVLTTEAVFSDDGLKRYILKKTWDESKPKIAVIMLAPSDASAVSLDNSSMLVLNNSFRLGYGGVTILNLFATLNDFALKQAEMEDVENLDAIVQNCQAADAVVYAPGVGKASSKAFQRRQEQILLALSPMEGKLHCLCDENGKARFQHPLSPAVRTWYLSPFKVAELLPKAEDSKDDSKKHSKGKGKTAAKEGESKRTSLP